jgi:hypothetical protein
MVLAAAQNGCAERSGAALGRVETGQEDAQLVQFSGREH